MRSRPTRAALLAALLLAAPPAAAAGAVERLAERGPPTLFVGALFTLSAPPGLLLAALRGRPLALPACRFGHGLKMLAAGGLLLPAGLLAAPFAPQGLPDAWLDGLVDAFQEDYCTRPLASLYP